MADVAAVDTFRWHSAYRTVGGQVGGSGVHGDEPGTDLDTVNGEPARQQRQQRFGDQEQYKLMGDWLPLYAHQIAHLHQAAPSLRMDLKLPQMWRMKNPRTVCQVIAVPV